MKSKEIEALKLKILTEAKKVRPRRFPLDDLIKEHEPELVLEALIALEDRQLIETGSYQVSLDDSVSLVDVTITPKGVQSIAP